MDRDFFAQPPPEIGQILSADSTLKLGKTGLPIWLVWSLRFGPILAILAFVIYRQHVLFGSTSANPIPFIATFFAGIMLIVGIPIWMIFKFTAYTHQCTYVGKNGISMSTLKGRRTGSVKTQHLLFPNSAEVHTASTSHTVNGIYSHTDYRYEWTNTQRASLFLIKGKFRSSKGTPKQGDLVYFARAADYAWSVYYLQYANQELQQTGAISFRVDSKRVVRVGQGFIEFHFGGEPVRVTKPEIAKVTLGGGTFAFKHVDAKWYSGGGKFNFKFGKMANGKVFMMALDTLMEYRWK